MNRPKFDFNKSISSYVLEGLVLLLGSALIPFIILSDREIFLNGYSEHSRTEILQAFLTLTSASIFWVCSVQLPAFRGWLLALAGFFTVVLIREMDFYLDFVYHGFWSTVVTLVLLIAAALVWRSRNTFKNGLMHFLSHNSYVFILVGAVVVLVFSRVFGSSDFLSAFMQDEFSKPFKTVVQEGLELFGYFLVTWGSVKYSFAVKKLRYLGSELKPVSENPVMGSE